MKILITGSNGLTGQAIMRELDYLGSPTELLASSKSPNCYTGKHKFELLDIRYPEKLNYLLDVFQPKAIINTAAISQIDDCEKDKISCHQVNYEAVLNLIKACTERNIHLTHMSTDFVFDGNQQIPYTEFDSRNPANYYGNCKLMAEQALTQSNCRHAIVRTALVYDYPQNIKRSNIFRWIYDSLNANQNIKLVNDQFRTPTFVDDLVAVLLKISILEKEGIWHYAGDEKMSVYEFGLKIADHFNFDKSLIQPVSSASLNQIGRRPAKTYLNSNHANRELGLLPHNISEAFDVIKTRID